MQGIRDDQTANMYQFGDEKTEKGTSKNFILTQSATEKDFILPVLARAFFSEEGYNKDEALQQLGLKNTYVQEILERLVQSYLYLPQKDKDEEPQTLPDDIQLAIVVAKRNALKLSQQQLKRYLKEVIIPAMQRFYDMGVAPRKIVDLFVGPANRRANIPWTTKSSHALLQLAAYLETKDVPDEEFWVTYALLPQVMEDNPGKKFLPACVEIYHRVLTNSPSKVGVATMANVGNSMVFVITLALNDFFRESDDDSNKKGRELVEKIPNRIHCLSAICAAHVNTAAKYFDEQRHKRLQKAFNEAGMSLLYPEDEDKASQKASAILMMVRVSVIWRCPDKDFFGDEEIPDVLDDFALTPLCFAGAIMRMELIDEDEHNRLGIVLINLATIIVPLETQYIEEHEKLKRRVCSACIATAGLWYTAVNYKEDEKIFREYGAIYIALSLIDRLDEIPTEKLKDLKGELSVVLSWIDKAVENFRGHRLHLLLNKTFLKELITPDAMQYSSKTILDELQKLTEGLAAMLSNSDTEVPKLNKDDTLLSFVKMVRYVLVELMGKELFEKNVNIFNKITEKLVSEAEDVKNAWERLYGPAEKYDGEVDTSNRLGLVGPLSLMKDDKGKTLYSDKELKKYKNVFKTAKDINPAHAAKALVGDN